MVVAATVYIIYIIVWYVVRRCVCVGCLVIAVVICESIQPLCIPLIAHVICNSEEVLIVSLYHIIVLTVLS